MNHLAIFTPPFIDLILEGKKTIESRFTKVRCAPYGLVKKGDTILMKESGGLVIGEFTAGDILTFSNLDENKLKEIAEEYSIHLCAYADDNFWENRKNTCYATLIYVENPLRYDEPFSFPKKDRRGWVIIK